MGRVNSWSQQEIAATVADYMLMLQQELAGQPYNKAAHRRDLMAKLGGRSPAAVEMKHQNISAVLKSLNRMWIQGYKPLPNVQEALREEVELWLLSHPELDASLDAEIARPAVAPVHFDFDGFLVQPPVSDGAVCETVAPYLLKRPQLQGDYIAREAANRSLGLAGELLVLQFERQRLIAHGCDKLADHVEHVAQTKGDGLGYDILSFEPSGRERFIEVKTTAFAKETPFYATRNEVDFSLDNSAYFVLSRVYSFRKRAHAFELPGAIANNCHLNPNSYICQIR